MSVENEKEIQQLKNRIRELADKSYNPVSYTHLTLPTICSV